MRQVAQKNPTGRSRCWATGRIFSCNWLMILAIFSKLQCWRKKLDMIFFCNLDDKKPLSLKGIASSSDAIFWRGILAPLYPVAREGKTSFEYNSEAIERRNEERTNGARSGGRKSHKSSEGRWLSLPPPLLLHSTLWEREGVIYFAHSTSCLELETVHSTSEERYYERKRERFDRAKDRWTFIHIPSGCKRYTGNGIRGRTGCAGL